MRYFLFALLVIWLVGAVTIATLFWRSPYAGTSKRELLKASLLWPLRTVFEIWP